MLCLLFPLFLALRHGQQRKTSPVPPPTNLETFFPWVTGNYQKSRVSMEHITQSCAFACIRRINTKLMSWWLPVLLNSAQRCALLVSSPLSPLISTSTQADMWCECATCTNRLANETSWILSRRAGMEDSLIHTENVHNTYLLLTYFSNIAAKFAAIHEYQEWSLENKAMGMQKCKSSLF